MIIGSWNKKRGTWKKEWQKTYEEIKDGEVEGTEYTRKEKEVGLSVEIWQTKEWQKWN